MAQTQIEICVSSEPALSAIRQIYDHLTAIGKTIDDDAWPEPLVKLVWIGKRSMVVCVSDELVEFAADWGCDISRYRAVSHGSDDAST